MDAASTVRPSPHLHATLITASGFRVPVSDATFWGRISDHRGVPFRVLHSTKRSQVAVMTVPAGQEAGAPETHGADQVILVLEGRALARVWSAGPDRPPVERRLEQGGVLVVPAGLQHWVKAEGSDDLAFFTVYSPPAY